MFKIIYLAICVSFGAFMTTTVAFADNTTYHKKSSSGSESYYHFSSSRPATGTRVFIFDPRHHAWATYNAQGQLVNEGKASGGQSYCPDIHRSCRTIVGHFRVISKGGPGCVSSKYPLNTRGGAKTPYCMAFHPKGYAVHGSNDVPNNRNVSHGCIRVTTAAARWLNQDFIKIGTPVIVLPYARK